MITIKNEEIAGIPSLHVIKHSLRGQSVPTIFFLHGFTSAKEHNLHVAYLLAEKGMRVILPDALHHGERETTLFGNDRALSFWDIVVSSITELEEMKDELNARRLIVKEKVGVIGTSMGAITLYGALTQYEWLCPSVAFMGNAYYEEFATAQLNMLARQDILLEQKKVDRIFARIRPYDLSKQVEKTAERPLLIWHGKSDQVVPFSYSEKLVKELQPYYKNKPSNLKFIPEENVSHKVSRMAVLQAVNWFEMHLSPGRASSSNGETYVK